MFTSRILRIYIFCLLFCLRMIGRSKRVGYFWPSKAFASRAKSLTSQSSWPLLLAGVLKKKGALFSSVNFPCTVCARLVAVFDHPPVIPISTFFPRLDKGTEINQFVIVKALQEMKINPFNIIFHILSFTWGKFTWVQKKNLDFERKTLQFSLPWIYRKSAKKSLN